MSNQRTKNFRRNQNLESFLTEINNDLWQAEQKLPKISCLSFPLLFIMGPLRSGSTLIMQWLANSGQFAYPTNLLSRFYKAPIVGSKIQLLLTDQRYNFRDEILDFSGPISYASENGKTQGALAPNEFWYFWRRFLPFKEVDYLPTEQLFKDADTKTIVSELAGVTDVFQKPFAMKGMILNYNIDFLDQLFEKAIFIHTTRDPESNVESALKARERQLGSIDAWYSFKIPEYPVLKELNPYEQVAGQVYYINKAVEKGLSKVAEHKKLTVPYEDFCENPEHFYNELKKKLLKHNHNIEEKYRGKSCFNPTRKKVTDPNILSAVDKFFS